MDSTVWFQMENKVRLLIKDLIEPTVNRVSEATKTIEKQGKAINSAIFKLEDIDASVSNLMKRLSVIDEFTRKVLEFEGLQSMMEMRFNREREEIRSQLSLFIQRQESFEENLEVLQHQRELLKTDIVELSQVVVNQKYELEEKIVQTSNSYREISSSFNTQFSLLEVAINQEKKNIEHVSKELIGIDTFAKEAMRLSSDQTRGLKQLGKKIELIKSDYPKEIDKVRNTCIVNTNEILNTKKYIKKVEKEMQNDESAIRNELMITEPFYVIIKDLPTLKILAGYEKDRLEKINYKKYSQGIFEQWKSLFDKAQDIIDTPLPPPPPPPPPKRVTVTSSQKKLKRQQRQNLRKQIAQNISMAVKEISKVDLSASDTQQSVFGGYRDRADSRFMDLIEETKELHNETSRKLLIKEDKKTEEEKTAQEKKTSSQGSRSENRASRGSSRRKSTTDGPEGNKTVSVGPELDKRPPNFSIMRAMTRQPEAMRRASRDSNGIKTFSRDPESENPTLTASETIKPPVVSLPAVVREALKKVSESQWAIDKVEESVKVIERRMESTVEFNPFSRPDAYPRPEAYSRPETYSSTSEEDEEGDSIIDFSPMIEQVRIQLQQDTALMFEDIKSIIESTNKSTLVTIEKTKAELVKMIESIKSNHDDYNYVIEKRIGEIQMLIQQAVNECNSASAQRKRDHNDYVLEFKRFSGMLETFEKQEATLSEGIEILSRSVDCLIDYSKISIALQNQDETDRESIFLMGYKQRKQQSNVISIDKRCLSCAGQSSSVISAFKIACLAYEPSQVVYHDKKFTRKEMLRLQRSILENFSRSPELENSDENRELHNKTMMTNRQWRPLSVPPSRFSTLTSPHVKTPDGENLPLLRKSVKL